MSQIGYSSDNTLSNSSSYEVRVLSNLQAIYTIIHNNPDMLPHEFKLLIISNAEYKVLNQIMNYNTKVVEELKTDTKTPKQLTAEHAMHCAQCKKMANMPKR